MTSALVLVSMFGSGFIVGVFSLLMVAARLAQWSKDEDSSDE